MTWPAASRRDALGAVAAITGSALLTAVGVSTTSAAWGREGDKCAANCDCCAGSACRDRRCRCKAGLDLCNRWCIDLQTNERWCGSCTERCHSGENFLDGSCFRACPAGSSGVCQDATKAACGGTFCNCHVRRQGGRACGGNNGIVDCKNDADCVAAGWPDGSFCALCGEDIPVNRYCVAPCQG